MTVTAGSVPPMTGRDLDASRAHVALHDHAVCMFADETQLANSLAVFLREGVARDELCVFVHSFASDAVAWEFIERAYGSREPIAKNIVVVSLYKQAFEGPQGRIDHAHVASVVGSITTRAQDGGHAGARIFVDASRRYFAQARADEWFAFESWLGRTLRSNVGLVCAYAKSDVLDPAHTARVLATHAYRFG